MTDSTLPTTLGILPMVNYKYLPPNENDYPYGNSAWFGVWHPGYSVFKYRRSIRAGLSDWGFVEMAGIFMPLYDFCGGLLTSSPNVRIYTPNIETFDTRNTWHDKGDQMWRAVGRAYGHSGRTCNRLGTDAEIAALLNLIPSVDPYLGPGPFTHTQIRSVAEKSISAWLATNAVIFGRRGIFGADRYTYDTYLRTVLRGIKTLPFAWNTLPAARVERTPTGTVVQRANLGLKHSLMGLNGAKYSAGTRYRNPNSGRAVSMCGAIMPDHGRVSMNPPAGYPDLAARIPEAEWSKLTAQAYLNLLPAELIHNG